MRGGQKSRAAAGEWTICTSGGVGGEILFRDGTVRPDHPQHGVCVSPDSGQSGTDVEVRSEFGNRPVTAVEPEGTHQFRRNATGVERVKLMQHGDFVRSVGFRFHNPEFASGGEGKAGGCLLYTSPSPRD